MASHRSFGGFGARPCIAIGKLGARLVVGRVPDRNALRNDQSSRTPAESFGVFAQEPGALQKKSSRPAVPVV